MRKSNRSDKKQNKQKKPKNTTARLLIGSSVALAALIGLILLPVSVSAELGGVTYADSDKRTKLFGPEIPENIVGGYVRPVVQSVLVAEDEDGDNSRTLYYAYPRDMTYHVGTCSRAYASASRMTLYEAYYLGYKPGQCCKAPSYEP